MVMIQKSQVMEWLLLDYLAKIHTLEEKISFYKQKYKKNFEEFEKHINTAKEENFEEWDDYLEWKAFRSFYYSYLEQIKEVKSGNFQLAG
jgi:hypothetical protein